MKTKALQYFTPEYLQECKKLSYDQIAQFLEDFRLMHSEAPKSPSKLISIKIPEDLLSAFKTKASLHGIPYQTQMKILMKKWLEKCEF